MPTVEFSPTPGQEPKEQGQGPAAGHGPGRPQGIRRQAETIIDTVIQSGPVRDREQLAVYVEMFPDQPEVAVARFLQEVRPRIADYTDPVI
ncbi:hypothetical protein ACFFGR_21385 [Arthrobacter liuii]|uniref:Uncharacterized protein n=1 Tax=Arthrobacter liuii TaxID=1476996 RepID=A0ABQ2AV21_9MICC|nr:hypothetical protein [Arthrobacter liuii]GGH98532.1 hypothetical protein GCM10007170_31290 [Arthrobacter liuii]